MVMLRSCMAFSVSRAARSNVWASTCGLLCRRLTLRQHLTEDGRAADHRGPLVDPRQQRLLQTRGGIAGQVRGRIAAHRPESICTSVARRSSTTATLR